MDNKTRRTGRKKRKPVKEVVQTTSNIISTRTATSEPEQTETSSDTGSEEMKQHGIESMCNSSTLTSILPASNSSPNVSGTISPKPGILSRSMRGHSALSRVSSPRSLNVSPQRMSSSPTLSVSGNMIIKRTSSPSPRDAPDSPKTSGSSQTPRSVIDGSPRNQLFVCINQRPINLTEEPIIYHKILGNGATAHVFEATISGFTIAVKRYKQEKLPELDKQILTQK